MSTLNTETKECGADAFGALNEKDRSEIEKLLAITRTAAATRRHIDLVRLDAQASNIVRWLLHRLIRERIDIVFTDLKRRRPETILTIDLRNRLFDHVSITPRIQFEHINAADCDALVDQLITQLLKDSAQRAGIEQTDLGYLR